jgi:hypothetical protein
MAKTKRKKAAAKTPKKSKTAAKRKSAAAKKPGKLTTKKKSKPVANKKLGAKKKSPAKKPPIAKKAAVAKKTPAAKPVRKPPQQGLIAEIKGVFTGLVDTLRDAEQLHERLDPGVSKEPE